MSTFKNIYYDKYKNKMLLWELNDNGETELKTFDHEIEYYVQDPTKKSPIKDIYGNPVIRQVTTNKDKLKDLKESGTKLYESDLSEESKFLHKRYGDQDDNIDFDKYVIANIDIEIQTEGTFPKPEDALFPINLITVELMRSGEMFTFGLNKYTGNKVNNYFFCESEEKLIENFCKLLKYKKTDCITGWNTTSDLGGFDIPYIVNRIDRLNLDCSLSPINKTIRKYNGDIEIVGISDLDLLKLYKKYTYVNQPSYSLDYIGNLEVGEGKMDTEGSIQDLWKRDWNLFVEYNVQDVLLVSKIDKKKKLIELAINFYTSTRTPSNKVCSTVAIVEGYIRRYMRRKNIVMSDRKELGITESIEGGYVEAIPGFYNNLISYDGTSLYPSIIRQFNISPETKVMNPTSEEGLIKTTVPGLYYRKDIVGIIPEIVTDLFNKRKYNKDLASKFEIENDVEKYEYYDSQQMIFKILLNSIYGAFLEKSFHFFDIDNGACVTNIGRTSIKYIAHSVNDYLNNYFYKVAKKYYPNFENKISKSNKVVVIDTDSVAGNSILNTNVGDISIEDIFNKVAKNIQEKSPDNFIAELDSLQSLSFNTEDRKEEYKPITYIKKHKVKKQMYKISNGDDSVIVTEDHSIIILRDEKYIEIKPNEIKYGDKIIKIC